MDIEFRKITEFPRGTLCALLKEGYSFEPRFERDCLGQWQEFDNFFYDNPHIAEVSGFMTVLDNTPIGFVSWNPTNIPISAEIGHNCIAVKYKGNGYGKRQMQLRRGQRRSLLRQMKFLFRHNIPMKVRASNG